MAMSSATHQKLDQPSARHAIKLVEADEVVVNVEADGRRKVFGKAVSDVASVRVPAGVREFEVLEIYLESPGD